MHQGVSFSAAADYFGMSALMIERVYGHHHPEYQAEVARAMGTGRKRPNETPMKRVNQTATRGRNAG
jgi:hypothetical protein